MGERTAGAVQPTRSIPARIFAGFAVVLLLFAVVSGISLWQHQRTAATLRLLHEGYLPLSLSISEARATQGAFATMVERTLEGGDTSATEGWLEIARRVRPFPLRRALDAANQAQRLVHDERDRATLNTLHAELEAVLFEYELSEDDFDALSSALANRDRSAAAAALASVRVRERQGQSHLSTAWQLINERIASTSRKARDDEGRALGLLVGLGLVALALGLAISFWSQQMLRPLTKLTERVGAVARGDLATRVEPHANDEIGHVASEFERMVDALSQRDAQLRRTERLAAVGRLAAHVTHEVRNPLNSIRLNVEMLEEDVGQAAPESLPMLTSVKREVDRLTDITEQYLRLVRLPEPKPESTDLGEFTQDLATFLKPEMVQAQVQLALALEPGLAHASVDRGQLRQALLNLCRNAREAMPDGGKIELHLRNKDDGVELSVSDTGSGIPESEREKIFELFYTTKQHGTGIGLPLCQQIVTAHGGRIRCTSAEGGGTRFEIWLPATREGTTSILHATEAT
ncbi:MAG: ATP-binding protein [Myxococcales bacterium]